MSRTKVLELFLPFRLFKKIATIRCTTTSAQILLKLTLEQNKMAGCSEEKNRRGS